MCVCVCIFNRWLLNVYDGKRKYLKDGKHTFKKKKRKNPHLSASTFTGLHVISQRHNNNSIITFRAFVTHVNVWFARNHSLRPPVKDVFTRVLVVVCAKYFQRDVRRTHISIFYRGTSVITTCLFIDAYK